MHKICIPKDHRRIDDLVLYKCSNMEIEMSFHNILFYINDGIVSNLRIKTYFFIEDHNTKLTFKECVLNSIIFMELKKTKNVSFENCVILE